MKLYNYWRSSSSWRVRIALSHKNLPYEYMPVNLLRDGGEQHKPAYHRVNPAEQVPALVIEAGGREQTLTQSLAIIEYLEELQPQPALLPKDLFLRGKVRAWANSINSGLQPLHNLSLLTYVEAQYKADKVAFAAHWLTLGLRALEEDVATWAGRCLLGDEVTMADVCLVPQLYGARRFGVEIEKFPTLQRVEAYLATLPAFQKAHADQQIDTPART